MNFKKENLVILEIDDKAKINELGPELLLLNLKYSMTRYVENYDKEYIIMLDNKYGYLETKAFNEEDGLTIETLYMNIT